MSNAATVATESEQQFIYRATWSDGRIYDTTPRPFSPDQPSFVRVAQIWTRKRFDPGATVVRMVRTVSEWQEG